MSTRNNRDISKVSASWKTKSGRLSAVALALTAVVAGAPAYAQSSTSPAESNKVSSKAVLDFWTPQRFLAAKPLELIPSPGHQLEPLSTTPAASGPQISAPAAKPTITGDASLATRIHPAVALASSGGGDGVSPAMTSSTGAYFTTTRVFPDAAVSTWPYIMAGRLVAYNPVSTKSLYCSASVLRNRLVVTAGHCVYHAGPTSDDSSSNKYFYKNFAFTPAYNNGAAPVGVWTYSWVITTSTWASGGGTVPNAQDVAILEMADKSGKLISNYTGYFGYATGGLNPNHLTIIGYPCNIDNCAKMQNTFAGAYNNGGNNTVVYGSAQRGGTSGGPWVQDFGVAGSGAPTGTGANTIRGVSSYGPIATEPKYLGASILQGSGSGSFGSILATACAHKAGNCP